MAGDTSSWDSFVAVCDVTLFALESAIEGAGDEQGLLDALYDLRTAAMDADLDLEATRPLAGEPSDGWHAAFVAAVRVRTLVEMYLVTTAEPARSEFLLAVTGAVRALAGREPSPEPAALPEDGGHPPLLN